VASRSQLFVNESLMQRVRRKEPLAIIMIALGLVFVGIWFTALVFDASDVGEIQVYAVNLVPASQQSFPAWTIIDWNGNPLNSIVCHHCHWASPGEICEKTPQINGIQVSPNKWQFNADSSQVADKATLSYIACSLAIPQNGSVVVILYNPATSDQSMVDMPFGNVISSLNKDGTTSIHMRKVSTIFANGSMDIEYSTVSTDVFFQPANASAAGLRIAFQTYVELQYIENSSQLKRISFWTFMGLVGGTGFLLVLIWRGVMFTLEFFVFRNAHRDEYMPV